MALTEQQDIPQRPKIESEPWTMRRLFPMRATVGAIVKIFASPLEVLLGFVVLILGVSVLLGRTSPILLYALAFGLLLGVLFERVGAQKPPPLDKDESKKK